MADKYPSIDAGTLRHMIHIQSPSPTRDAAGQPINTWTTVLTTYASIVMQKERQYFQSGQFTAQGRHEITFRCSSVVNIDPSMRVLFGLKVFRIEGIDNVQERNILVKLTCLAINEGTLAPAC